MHQQALTTVAAVLQNDDPRIRSDHGPDARLAALRRRRVGGSALERLVPRWATAGRVRRATPPAGTSTSTTVAERLPLIGYDIGSNPKVKENGRRVARPGGQRRAHPGHRRPGTILGSGRVGWSARLFREAFEHYRDPRYAQALAMLGGGEETLWDGDISAEVARAVADRGATLTYATRHLPGYGLAILEAGSAAQPRGLSLYYGNAAGGYWAGPAEHRNVGLRPAGADRIWGTPRTGSRRTPTGPPTPSATTP
ncbi:MAG: hypothetical protein M5U09_02700 [Gammaproteobacteria bacterium]|nr:hypothetical protein [Gammaproteobacteria bacterium]